MMRMAISLRLRARSFFTGGWPQNIMEQGARPVRNHVEGVTYADTVPGGYRGVSDRMRFRRNRLVRRFPCVSERFPLLVRPAAGRPALSGELQRRGRDYR